MATAADERRASICACLLAVALLCYLGVDVVAFAPAVGGTSSVGSGGFVGSSVANVFEGSRLHASAPSMESPWVGGRHLFAAVTLAALGALIVQNKGGGHGEIGYHLALILAKKKGMKVTLVNDSAAKKESPPFDSYADLEAAGVVLRWVDLADASAAAATVSTAGPCDFVFDNQNVCPKEVQKIVKPWNPKAYVYVSSGGMYKPVPEGPLLETGDVKEDNKQLSIERNASELGLPLAAFRPQYIYGPKTGKRDYLDWFFDRITRGAPILLPVDGNLRTTLTHAEDVASMLASVVNNPEAASKDRVYNCGTDVRVSHREVVEACAKAAGKDPATVLKTVVCYDPAKLKGADLPKKGKFPFRETHFGVGVDRAKSTLGWAPKHKLEEDLGWYFEEYKRLGKDSGDVARDWDEAVLGLVAA